MSRKLWIALGSVAGVLLLSAGALLLTPREGDGDLRPDSPKAEEYNGYVVHSSDEYNRKLFTFWDRHLAASLLDKGPDGSMVLHPIPTTDVWFCLFGKTPPPRGVVQLPDELLRKIPVGSDATC